MFLASRVVAARRCRYDTNVTPVAELAPPTPADGFEWRQTPAGLALVCRALDLYAPHVFTTRGWTLGSAPDGDRAAGWEEVARVLDVDIAHLARAHQVHGASVVVHRADEPLRVAETLQQADVIVSDDRALAPTVQAADCVPLLIADRRTGVVAAAHAGWRGMAARVPEVAVQALAREFGSRPADLVAVAGPSIGACCYDVGADVRDAFRRGGFADSLLAKWFFAAPQPTDRNPSMPGLPGTSRPHHWFFDGWAVTRNQLEEAGIPRHQIHIAGLCTASHSQLLCSYRRDGSSAGRLAAAIRRSHVAA
jgi:polyphenol oxidase